MRRATAASCRDEMPGRLEAFREKTGLEEAHQLRGVGSGHHVEVGLCIRCSVWLNNCTQHRFAVLCCKPSGETRPLTNFFDVAHLPGNIPQKQDLLTVRALDVYHLTAGGVAGRFDQHDARRNRMIGLIVNSLIAVEDSRRYVWLVCLSFPNGFLQLSNLDLRKTRLSHEILEIGLGEEAAGMIRMPMSGDDQLSR